MSYIDCIKHEFTGYLNGLPIYHPIEVYKAGPWGDYDFSCTPENLVIGGGAGEHPALVIHNLGALVASYVLHSIDKFNEIHDEYLSPPESSIERLYDLAFSKDSDNLEFCGWQMFHYSSFVINAKSKLHASPLQDSFETENWIELSVGKFIFYSMPRLNPFQPEILNLKGGGFNIEVQRTRI